MQGSGSINSIYSAFGAVWIGADLSAAARRAKAEGESANCQEPLAGYAFGSSNERLMTKLEPGKEILADQDDAADNGMFK